MSRDASRQDIESAFRKKGMELHPRNRVGDEEAEKKFTELCRAYSMLCDEGRRECYNMTVENKEIPSEAAYQQFNEKF